MDIDINKYLNSFQVKETFEYKELGDEMYRHFGKGSGRKIFPLFSMNKYPHNAIRDAWKAYLETGKKDFNYFMGVLNKLVK